MLNHFNLPALEEFAQTALGGQSKAEKKRRKAENREIKHKTTILVADAGTGKSIGVLKAVIKQGVYADFFVPNHKLALELKTKIQRMNGRACVIGGRGHAIDDEPLCKKHEAIDLLLQSGITSHQDMLCIQFDFIPGRGPVELDRCEYFGHCGYAKQFRDKAPIRIYTHAWLGLPRNIFEQNDDRVIQLAVVDEDFLPSLITQDAWSIGKLLARPNTLGKEIVETLQAKKPLIATLQQAHDDLKEVIEVELYEHTRQLPVINPSMPIERLISKLQGFRASGTPVALLRTLKQALLAGEDDTNTIWLGAETDEIQLHVSRLIDPQRLRVEDADILLMDATPNLTAIKALFPGIEVTTLKAQRQAFVVQVYDSPVSKARLEADNAVASDIIHAAAAMAHSRSVGLCAPKSLIKEYQQIIDDCSIVSANFGGLRGLDGMKDTQIGIVIGRNQPTPFAVESIARAIWPEKEINFHGNYIERPAGYRMKDGTLQGVIIHDHPDPRCQSVLRQIRESETIQAIDRNRLIHRDTPKPVLLFSNLPVPVDVDVVLQLRDLIGYKHMATLIYKFHGVLPLNADWLLDHAGLFSSHKAASRWSEKVVLKTGQNPIKSPQNLKGACGAIKSPQNLYISLIVLGGFKLFRLCLYRLPGDRGKPRKAVTYLTAFQDIRDQLKRHHRADAIKILGWAPGQAPIPKTPAIKEPITLCYSDESGQWHEADDSAARIRCGQREHGQVFYSVARTAR